jgi:histidyl-tRNA synthetase
VLVLPATPEQNLAAARVGRLCRSVVPCAVDYTGRSLKAKMRSAAKTGVPIVAILGEDEAARQVVQLRDMHSGAQAETSWDRLPEAFA